MKNEYTRSDRGGHVLADGYPLLGGIPNLCVNCQPSRGDREQGEGATTLIGSSQRYDLSHIVWAVSSKGAIGRSDSPRSMLGLVSVTQPKSANFEALICGLLRDLAHRLGIPMSSLRPIAPRLHRGLRALFAVHGSSARLARDIEAIVAP